jgi:long-subunit fatty acid transport protein
MAAAPESHVTRLLTAVGAAVSMCFVPSIAAAQEAPPVLEFNFSNPGARSLGLAGAFVALADDATAAFANPAGLVQLSRSEVSVEFRRRDYSTPFTAGGRAQGAPTGWGIDTVDGIRTSRSNETTSGLSFLSFVYPGNKWSLALFHHRLADFSISTEINGLFADAPGGGWIRYEDQLSSTELDIVGTGLTGAFQVSEHLSLGFGVTCFSGSVENRGAGYWVTEETFWDWNSFPSDMKWFSSEFTVDDTDVGFNVGLLWKFADSWRIGAVYRKGPRFDYELFNRAGALHPEPEGTIVASVTDHSITFPDVWGLGIAYRSPEGSLTVGFEWDRVEYSTIGETLDSPLVDTSMAAIDDANELHLGAEYVFLKSSPLIAIRGGVWRDPDHRFRYIGDDVFEQALYQQGEDLLHVTAGVGIAFTKFQIDLGADLSQNSDVVALSAIYSF